MKDLKNVRETAAMEKYIETGSKIRPYVGNSFEEISKILEENKNIILEGAQGTLLDVDLGNYPYVTSSHTTVAGALSGTGLSRVDAIIGVVKSYITRVGNGPLPTELTDETGKKLQTQGNEIGTTTGRTRRCGWLDLPLLKYAAKVNGIKNSSLAVTKLDVFSGFDKIMVCTAYDINGKKTEMPFNVKNLESVKPVYEEMDGWNIEENEWNRIAKEGYEELPSEAKKYLEKIENFTGIPVSIVSIGPERSRTVFKKNITGFLG
jgi:adenylosuccinate synthase